jgi:hypothetical protein
MKTLLTLVVLGGLGWLGYQYFIGPRTPSVLAYKTFADALAQGNFDDAAQLAREEAWSEVARRRSRPRRDGKPEVKYRSVRERKLGASENEVEVRALQVQKEGASSVSRRHTAVLKLSEGTWRVTAFSEVEEE